MVYLSDIVAHEHASGALKLISQSLTKHSFTLIIGTHCQQNLNFTFGQIVKLLKLYSLASKKTFQRVSSL